MFRLQAICNLITIAYLLSARLSIPPDSLAADAALRFLFSLVNGHRQSLPELRLAIGLGRLMLQTANHSLIP
jgi:hypothetical protein